MNKTLNLCLNCLENGPGVRAFSVGPAKGNQRDLYRNQVNLCEPCRTALENGDFDVIHGRYRRERTIKRG